MLCEGVRLYCTASTANAFLSKLPFWQLASVSHREGKISTESEACALWPLLYNTTQVRMYESTEVQTV